MLGSARRLGSSDTLLLVPFVRRSDQENDRVDEAPEAGGPPPGPICYHHRASQEEEEEEEEDEKGTYLLLLFMTSLTILSSLSFAGVWVLLENIRLSDFWEMTFSTVPCIWQSLV